MDAGTVANLSAYQKANPVADPEPDDFEPDGTWYRMIGGGPGPGDGVISLRRRGAAPGGLRPGR